MYIFRDHLAFDEPQTCKYSRNQGCRKNYHFDHWWHAFSLFSPCSLAVDTNWPMSKANGGIGFELASQLLTDSSKHVLFGSRSVEKGKAALKDLQSRKLPGSVELLQLDVDSVESFTAAAKSVESKHSRYADLFFSQQLNGSPFQLVAY